MKKILFPTDFSEGAKNALKYTIELVEFSGPSRILTNDEFDAQLEKAEATSVNVPDISVQPPAPSPSPTSEREAPKKTKKKRKKKKKKKKKKRDSTEL